jgi:hypothetical protein
MSFVLGNTLHTTPDGRLVEFDETGSSITTVDPASLSLAACSAFTQYLEIYRRSQLGTRQPGESRMATRRRAVSDRRKLRDVQDAAWAVERAIWQIARAPLSPNWWSASTPFNQVGFGMAY